MKPGTALSGAVRSSVCSQLEAIPPSLVWCLCSPGPPAARSNNCSYCWLVPQLKHTVWRETLYNCVTKFVLPRLQALQYRDPHYGPRSTTRFHGDGDGFLPSSGWHFLQHLPSVRPVTALSEAPLETETPAQEAAGIHSTVAFLRPVHARESPGWDLCGISGRQAEQTRMGESTLAQTALGMGLTSG